MPKLLVGMVLGAFVAYGVVSALGITCLPIAILVGILCGGIVMEMILSI